MIRDYRYQFYYLRGYDSFSQNLQRFRSQTSEIIVSGREEESKVPCPQRRRDARDYGTIGVGRPPTEISATYHEWTESPKLGSLCRGMFSARPTMTYG